jgi:hypothetical protein
MPARPATPFALQAFPSTFPINPFMKKPSSRKASRKLGVKAHDTAKKARKIDRNFAQSRDIHEDRGAIQSHLAQQNRAATRRQK